MILQTIMINIYLIFYNKIFFLFDCFLNQITINIL